MSEPIAEDTKTILRICKEAGADDVTMQVAEHAVIGAWPVEIEPDTEAGQLLAAVRSLHALPPAIGDPAHYRGIMMQLTHDWRALLIKLAERYALLSKSRLPRQDLIPAAVETLHVYAPLAEALGMHQLTTQLEDAALAIIDPRAYRDIARKLEQYQKDSAAYLKEHEENIHELTGYPVSARRKHNYSIYRKLQKHDWSDLYDIYALRVITPTNADCYAALGEIHSLYKPVEGRFKDYIARPKPNGYQSLHTTVLAPDKPLEIQIRTQAMHEEAEWGRPAHTLYKGGEAFPLRDGQDPAVYVSELIEANPEIYVFTPTQEVFALPKEATALDFAYYIHTDVGNRTVGAKANGKIIPLSTNLITGQTVEVMTGPKNTGPRADWMNIVKTRRARSKVRAGLRRRNQALYQERGEELFKQEIKTRHLTKDALETITKDNGVDEQTLYLRLGNGDLSVQRAFRALQPVKDPKEARLTTRQSTQPAFVPELPDVQVVLARCCHPFPPEPIIGHVKSGAHVTVHALRCPQVAAMGEERQVTVVWNQKDPWVPVDVFLSATDRPGLLKDITGAVTAGGGNITASNGVQKDGIWEQKMTIEVRDQAPVLAQLRQIRGVITVSLQGE